MNWASWTTAMRNKSLAEGCHKSSYKLIFLHVAISAVLKIDKDRFLEMLQASTQSDKLQQGGGWVGLITGL